MNERTENIIHRYKAGETLRDLAGVYGISYERVRQILAGAGVPRRPRSAWETRKPDPARDKMLKRLETLIKKKMSYGEISRALGISYQQVVYACKMQGVKSLYKPDFPEFKPRAKRLKELTKTNTLSRSVRIMRGEGNKITSKWVYDNWERLWPQGR